ncbi:site-specific integrase [Bounagaea algeriensis]
MSAKKWRARTNFRDYDGATRPVLRTGSSKQAARSNLLEALRDRGRASQDEEITSTTKIKALAGLWLRELNESDKARRTKETYHEAWSRDLADAVGELRVSEVTTALATRVLRAVQEHAGAGSAKHAKVVLSGVMGLAVRYDASESNPIGDVVLASQSRRSARQSKVSVTVDDLPVLRKHLRGNKTWRNRDLPDVVDALAGLGCRIGELLALDWSKVDFTAGTIAIEGTTIRVTGSGLAVQEHTKSSAGMRTVTPPKWLMDLLRRRYAKAEAPWVFPTITGTLRDPDNMRGFLREAVRDTQWEGLHPHAFRHLVATELDRAGLSAREIADYLGHERVSMTQDVYMNRKTVGNSAAEALASLETGT